MQLIQKVSLANKLLLDRVVFLLLAKQGSMHLKHMFLVHGSNFSLSDVLRVNSQKTKGVVGT
jgi:hypothetical protein